VKKEDSRLKRHSSIKLKMHGTDKMPRLVVHRSLKNLSAEVIDDTQNKTLFSITTLDKEIRQKFPSSGNIKAAEFFGEVFGRRAKEKGIAKIIFDRAGYLYHGRIKAFADGLRKGGLEF
jgi:large subunit ribosomal protein L18